MGEPGPRVVLPCPNCGARIRLEVEKPAQGDAAERRAEEARSRARLGSRHEPDPRSFWQRYFPPLSWM